MRLKRSSTRSPVVPGDAFRSLAGRAVTLLARVEGAGRDKRSASLVVGRRAESSPLGRLVAEGIVLAPACRPSDSPG